MASVTENQPPQNPAGETPGKGELLVDQQIRRTRRALKIVDLAAGMISLVIGVLVFLLIVAALDHWVIPGGWGPVGRTVLFLMLVAGVGWHGWHVFWPMLRRSINPAYAAHAIEQSSPALKNSLLNFLLLRKRKQRISRQVFQAIEQQAASRLSQVPMDSVVDRSAVLRLGYLLLTVVAICALYRVLSPKDLFTSAGRVLLPWTNVIAPSRVQLSAITPGDMQTAKGERIDVSAEVLGLDEGEPVRLRYSTADQQVVEQEILMVAGVGGVRFEAKLPQRASEGGVQQDLTYWIEAGDARSPTFHVSVFARPTLVVQSVRYNYPDYTGYPSHEETNTGDLRAVEGTVVTITALSNQPIETGHVDFEADGRQDLLMKAEGQQATVSFPLELRDDRRTPRHQSYVLRYSTTEGRKNKLPPTYQIEVTPDYSPEIRLLSPEEEVVDVGIDEQVTIEVEARDPDFAVRNVAILGEVAGQQVLKETLLSKKNHTGRFFGQMQLVPSQQGLKVGDVLEYWGAAADNRRPKANLAFTSHHKIRIVGPGKEGEQASDQQGEGDGGEGESQPGEGESDSSEEGDEDSGGESDDSGGESGEQGQDGQGQSGAGEAGEGMSDELNKQQGGKAGEGESSDGNEDSQSEAEGQAGGESEGEQQDGESSESEDGENSSGGEPSEQQASGEQEKVSPDGDDDAAAFDRMAEHFDEQNSEEQDSDEQGEGDPSEDDDPSGAGKGEQQEGQGDASDGTADPDQSDHGKGTEEAETGEPGEESNSDSAEGMPQESDSEGGGAEGDPSEQQGEGSDQEGEQSEDDGGAEGQMSNEQGESGTGENPGDNEGTTASEDGQSPEEKQSDKPSAEGENDQEAPSEGQGETESDSEGSQGGDRSGGGQEGAGQQADAEGKGGAGEHQAADEGGSKSEQPGEGETSEQAGGEKQSDGATGESSEDQAGNGSKSSDKAGDQAGGEKQGESGESQQGEAGENMSGEGEPSEKPSGSDQESSSPASSQPTDGGGQGSEGSPPPSGGEIAPGDEANLDYARKQTDLILDKLDDQLDKKEVDEKLLEKLGWSKNELQRFVNRWKNLKRQAAGEDESAAADAKQQLDEALQSLGLGRDRETGFHSQTAKDKLRELQDSYRGKIPLKYQQRVRAYVKGTAASDDEK